MRKIKEHFIEARFVPEDREKAYLICSCGWISKVSKDTKELLDMRAAHLGEATLIKEDEDPS